ncbi:MAG: hypothetical protein E7252_00520 [Lachnospira sp.]|nr:hypothetical protein [Lachnospira sp.]
MNKKYIRITVIAMLCAMAFIATDIILKYQHLERKSHEISEGFNTASQKGPIKMGMKSKTDTFKVDDVTFDIYYGMYEEGDETPESSYKNEDEKLFFVMYMSEYNIANYESYVIDDYKNAGTNYFIKEISDVEVFSGEYAYTLDKGFIADDVEYKHQETITIVKELFSKSKGIIAIEIVALVPLENGGYKSSYNSVIKLNYEFISEDTIKIEYRHIR